LHVFSGIGSMPNDRPSRRERTGPNTYAMIARPLPMQAARPWLPADHDPAMVDLAGPRYSSRSSHLGVYYNYGGRDSSGATAMAFQWLIFGAAEPIPSSHRDIRPASAVEQFCACWGGRALMAALRSATE
jgi:hypothetical protein